MDIHQLRVFQAAARSGSFTRASEQLRLSQSTVSQHIRRLEDSLGCLLFLRVGKRVVVSQAGDVLLEHAERIFNDVANAELAVRELNSLKRGKVRLGICPTALSCRVPDILADYSRAFPDIDLVVLTAPTYSLVQSVKQRQLDMAVVITAAPTPGVCYRALGTEEMVVAVSRDHPLARKPALTPDDLGEMRFILYEKGTAIQDAIDGYFRSLGVAPQVTMALESIEAIKALVRAGLGASIVPLCSVDERREAPKLRVLRVKGRPFTCQLGLVMLEAATLPQAARELAKRLSAGLAAERPIGVAVNC